MDNITNAFYLDAAGRAVKSPLSEEAAQALLSGQDICLYTDSSTESDLRIRRDGPPFSYGIPCIRLSEGEACPRQLLRNAQSALEVVLPLVEYRVTSDFYVFPTLNFTQELVLHASSLSPCACPGLERFSRAIYSSVCTVSFQHSTRQYQMILTGPDIAELLDLRISVQAEISQFCSSVGMQPFWIPKMDGLAPSGLSMSFICPEGTSNSLIKAALLGLHAFAKPLTLAFCTQVNSYKRITPKLVAPGQRIPCYLCCSCSDDNNAIVSWHDMGGSFTVYLADNYCNTYLAAAFCLAMLGHGVSQYGNHPSDEVWNCFISSRERMPNSLCVAAELWSECRFAKNFLGRTLWEVLYNRAQQEWMEYCDIAHPWELMRGVQYEQG